MTIGDRIRVRREEQGLTLAAVAEVLEVNRSTVKRYESGQTQRIPLSTIEKLARALHTTTEYLMGWDGDGYACGQDAVLRELVQVAGRLPEEKRDMLLSIAKVMLAGGPAAENRKSP